MTSSPESQHLDNRHRNTLRQIFQHPVSHNIEWHSVTSLLDAIGSVDVHHDGQVAVRVGSESGARPAPAADQGGLRAVVTPGLDPNAPNGAAGGLPWNE